MGAEPGSNETVLALDGVTKRFGAAAAVDRVSMSIRRGEVFTLLGPSGCGKTTTLRLVAGLEHPDAGCARATRGDGSSTSSRGCPSPSPASSLVWLSSGSSSE